LGGEIHQYQKEEDLSRQDWLSEIGYKVIRFSNDQVLNESDSVLREIRRIVNQI